MQPVNLKVNQPNVTKLNKFSIFPGISSTSVCFAIGKLLSYTFICFAIGRLFSYSCLFCYRKLTFIHFCLFCYRKVIFIHFGLFCYWLVQVGLTPLTFIWHRLSPLDVLYFQCVLSSQWKVVTVNSQSYSANFTGIFEGL